MTAVPSPSATFGACPCGGSYEERAVEVSMVVDGDAVVLTNVPQGACPSCGSRVYKRGVLESLEATMRGSDPPRMRLAF
jgi:YgiT-type zinc finger domain-containing protein